MLGQSWILPHEYQVRKYNFHKVKSWGGILWTVPHEYQVKKIIIYTKCLDNRGLKKKNKKKKKIKKKCLDNRGPWPMSIK